MTSTKGKSARLFAFAATMLVAACSAGAPDGGGGEAAERSATAPAEATAPSPAPAASPTQAAEAIKRESSDARLDFDYAIPAEAAAIPALRDMLLARADEAKRAAIADHADYVRELPEGVEPRPYGLDTGWSVTAETPQLLVLLDETYRYLGGAHGNTEYHALIWDKAAGREIAFADLFTDAQAALATVRTPFCEQLDEARRKKRGGDIGRGSIGDSSFTRCPPFEEVTPLPARTVGGKFARIHFAVPPYVAGAYAEGSYDIDLFIPEAMIPLVAPRYRASFPG